MWPRKTFDIGIDLGTSKFSICVKGEGVIATESAHIAYRGDTLTSSSVVAVGDAALALWGRCPMGVTVVSPMKDGVIVDAGTASILLNRLMQKHNLGSQLSRRRVLVATLFGATEIEHRAFIDVASSLGVKTIKTVAEPLAAAVGSGLPMDEPRARMLVDIGSGATEMIVVSRGQVVSGRSLRIGGDAMDEAIVHYALHALKVRIGSQVARSAKEWLSSTSPETSFFLLKGIDLPSRSPTAVLVSREELRSALYHAMEEIVTLVASEFAHLTPEIATDLVDTGISLSGGSALSATIQKRISDACHLDVNVVHDPSYAVVRGCDYMIQNNYLAS